MAAHRGKASYLDGVGGTLADISLIASWPPPRSWARRRRMLVLLAVTPQRRRKSDFLLRADSEIAQLDDCEACKSLHGL